LGPLATLAAPAQLPPLAHPGRSPRAGAPWLRAGS
jgi:hypothetical protein